MKNEEQEIIEWTSHPAKESPVKTVIALLVVVLMAATAYIYMEGVDLGVYFVFLSILVLVLGLRKYLFPTKYRLTPSGVEKKLMGTTKKKPWGYFERYIKGEDGFYLSPFEESRWLEQFRAWYVKSQDPEVEEYIKRMIKGEQKGDKNGD